MIFFEDLPPVDMLAVAADDRLIEALRAGMAPANYGPVAVLLARWRDECVMGL